MNKKTIGIVLAMTLFLCAYAIIPLPSQAVYAKDYSGVYKATTYIYIVVYGENDSGKYAYNSYGIRQGDMVVLNSSGCLANCPYADSMVKYIKSGALKPVYVTQTSGTYNLYNAIKNGIISLKKK